MDRYIGLDVHAASSTFAVVDARGKRLSSQVVETNGQALLGFLQTIPGQRHVCLEEGTQSAWLHEILSPHAAEVVVMAVAEKPNANTKNDQRDAFGLADKLRQGGIERPVFKETGPFHLLRELSRAHAMVVGDVVRGKNRIKSLYRARGIVTPDRAVYSEKDREAWLAKLPAAAREVARTLYAEHDALKGIHAQAEKALIAEAHRHPIARVLETCPGLGRIRVAYLLSIVVSPHRFRTKRQFWSYCGLGIETHSSSDWVHDKDGRWVRAKVPQARGLNRNHNRILKNVFNGAAMTVIGQRAEEPLYQGYERLVQAGTKPNLAKLTLARKIAAIALAMWKSEKEYDTARPRKQG